MAQKKYIVLFLGVAVIATVIYLWSVILTPVLTSSKLLEDYTAKIKIVRLSLSAGYAIIWFLAAYAIANLKKYISLIGDAREKPALQRIYLGLLVIWLGFLLWPQVPSIRGLFLQDPNWIKYTTYAFNYLIIIPTLAGLYLVFAGSKRLLQSLNIKVSIKARHALWFVAFFPLTLVYFWLIFTNPIRSASLTAGIPSTFYLSDPMIIATIALPAIASWALGILSAIMFEAFKTKTGGIIYRRALPSFCNGFVAVVFGTLLLDLIISFGTNKLFQLGMAALLVTVYTFIMVLCRGFFFLVRGTKKLTMIELYGGGKPGPDVQYRNR